MKLNIFICFLLVVAEFFIISECSAKNKPSETAKESQIALEKMMQKFYEGEENRLSEAFLPSENGRFTGKHEIHYPSGKIKSEINYKDGKQNGLAIWWSENGQKDRERNYIDGKLNGLESKYRFSGQKLIETIYKDGKQNGEQVIWNINGHKISEVNYTNGKRNGVGIGWNDSGQKTAELNWKDGELNGLQRGWLENNEITQDYKSGAPKEYIKSPKTGNEAGDFSGLIYDMKFIDAKEILGDLKKAGEDRENTNSSNEPNSSKVMQEIKSRCQTQMGEHGFAMVKACVDQDIEALHTIQNSSYMDKHEAITKRCINQMVEHGWAMIKACADQDIEAEDALRKY